MTAAGRYVYAWDGRGQPDKRRLRTADVKELGGEQVR
jgi:hypothetical protein